jgi:hypothetical protein
MSRGITNLAYEVDTTDDAIPAYSTSIVVTDEQDVDEIKPALAPVRKTRPNRKFNAPEGLTLKTQQSNNLAAEEAKQLRLARKIREMANKAPK